MKDKFTLEEVQKELLEFVKKGFLACILSPDKNTGKIMDSYINGNQVIVRCPHCLKIVNIGKMNPKPDDLKEAEK